MNIQRILSSEIKESLEFFPVVAILGPRQCGKTTLAKEIIAKFPKSIYLDLELHTDLQKLEDPEFYLTKHNDKLICIDEIQLKPNLFPLLRAIIDQNRQPGRFLILGSASQDLIKQSTETLAGRIDYYELSPFMREEIEHDAETDHWIKGGFPDSFLSRSDKMSLRWRSSFIRTFLERDLSNLGFNLSPQSMHRFWIMLAHCHSTVLNKVTLSNSLGVSSQTIQSWMDVFEQTFMMRVLRPYSSNTKKRLVKSPKVYIRDSGILHKLLDLDSFDHVMGHPISGASWEGYAVENILVKMNDWKASFYRTSNGAEIDLILEKRDLKLAIEFKISSSPKVEKGSYLAMEDLGIDVIHVIVPNGSGEQISPKVRIDSILTFLDLYKDQ
jgi:predicted AAA+ superfamily ATPase